MSFILHWVNNLPAARNIPYLTGQKYRVWGEEGTHVTLPCYLSPQTVKDNLRHLYKGLEVHWVRHGGR